MKYILSNKNNNNNYKYNNFYQLFIYFLYNNLELEKYSFSNIFMLIIPFWMFSFKNIIDYTFLSLN